MLHSLIATFVIIFCYAAFFIGIGQLCTQKLWARSSIRYHIQFILGAYFFTGATIFTATWLAAALTTSNLKLTLLCTTLLYISLITYQASQNVLKPTRWREYVVIGLLFIVFSMIGFRKALAPMPLYFVDQPELVNPFAGFGVVVHSFRAGNLTEYIVSENTLPRINQHTGQALLASIPLFLKPTSAQLSLVIWMIVFITFTTTTFYGLSRSFITDRYRALIPVALVLLGNTVLSPFYSSTTDTENALFLASNVESVFGILSCVVLLILTYEHIILKRITPTFVMVLLTTSFVWNIFSGQMILLFSLLLICGLVVYKNQKNLRMLMLVLLSIFTCGAVLGILLLGGMLAPASLVNKVPVPGVLTVHNDSNPPLALRFPRTGESGSRLKDIYFSKPGATLAASNLSNVAETKSLSSTIKEHAYLHMFGKLIRSVQVVFFPLVGLALLFTIIRRESLQTLNKQFLYTLWCATGILFFTGWVVSSCFTLYGYHWELSRFFYVGLSLSMFLLGVSIAICFNRFTHARAALVFFIGFIMCGPVLELVSVHLIGNIYLEPTIEKATLDQLRGDATRTLSLHERFNFLITSHGMFGTHYNAK